MKFGEAPKNQGIKKLTIANDEIKFINILSIDEDFFLNTKTHFLKGIGSVHCSTVTDEDGIRIKGDCCNVIADMIAKGIAPEDTKDYPASKYVLPIMVFTTTDKNTFNLPVSFCRLELTEKDYKALLEELDDSEVSPQDVTKRIFRVKGVADGVGQYQRIVPKLKAKGAFDITQVPQVVESAKNFLMSYKDLIRSTMGKDLNEEKLRRAFEQTTQKVQAPPQNTLGVPQQLPQPIGVPQTLGVPQQIPQTYAIPQPLPYVGVPQQAPAPELGQPPLPEQSLYGIPQPSIQPSIQPQVPTQLGQAEPQYTLPTLGFGTPPVQQPEDSTNSLELDGLDLSQVMQDIDSFYNN